MSDIPTEISSIENRRWTVYNKWIDSVSRPALEAIPSLIRQLRGNQSQVQVLSLLSIGILTFLEAHLQMEVIKINETINSRDN